ncbi:MAG: DUF3489 domain-containing protein [Alphaproteobacteria bacterium]
MAKKLTDTQLIILSAASQREDLSVLPLPDTLKLPGGAAKKSLTALLTRGLIEEVSKPIDDREEQPAEYRITASGLAAIGVQDEEDGSPVMKGAKSDRKNSKKPTTPAPVKNNTTKSGAKPSGKPELLLRLMRRKQGATVTALQDATGWQPHSVRAALSGLRKKSIDITRSKNPKGETVYRVEA